MAHDLPAIWSILYFNGCIHSSWIYINIFFETIETILFPENIIRDESKLLDNFEIDEIEAFVDISSSTFNIAKVSRR